MGKEIHTIKGGLMKFLNFLVNHFINTITNQKGSWVAVAIGGSAVVGGTVAYMGQEKGAKSREEALAWQQEMAGKDPEFFRAPEYAETAGARASWWDKMQEWGKDPDYGAIAPNWEDIWSQASKKVSDYWQGTPTTPGVMDRVKASAARRGVSESPAMGTLTTRAGAEEAGQLKDLAITQATKRAEFGEAGRKNWLQSLMGLSQLQVPGTWKSGTGQIAPMQQQPVGMDFADVMGGVGDLAGTYYSGKLAETKQEEQRNWLMDLYGGGQTQSSITGGGGMDNWGWGDTAKQVWQKPDTSWANAAV